MYGKVNNFSVSLTEEHSAGYCLQVWTLHFDKDTDKLQGNQQKAVRIVLGKKTYEKRLIELGLLNLEEWR